MVTVLTVVGVSYVAFSIWLMVLIVNRQKKWSKRLKWTAGVVVALPILYVLSSGPMQTLLIRRNTIYSASGTVITQSIGLEPKVFSWSKLYRPLTRVSESELGAPLIWYWALFPLREGRPFIGRQNPTTGTIVIVPMEREKLVNPPAANPDAAPEGK